MADVHRKNFLWAQKENKKQLLEWEKLLEIEQRRVKNCIYEVELIRNENNYVCG